MTPRICIALGALWAGLAVALGAFGAHALRVRLEAADTVALWETGVRYQLWHALALVLFGLFRERHPGSALPAWGFLLGSLLFSGSLYGLALEGPARFLGPVTPLGGLGMLLGWTIFFGGAIRSRAVRPN